MSENDKKLLGSSAARLRREGAPLDFDETFTLHHRAVFRTARALVRDEALADDITQEVFLRLYRNLDSIRSETPLRIWLMRVTRNVTIDALRRRDRIATYDSELAERKENDNKLAASLEAHYEHRVELEAARRVLDKIKEPMRSCLLLKQQGLPFSEIAAELSIKEGTVGSLIARGRKEFIRLFGELSREPTTQVGASSLESKVDLLIGLLRDVDSDYITSVRSMFEEPGDDFKVGIDKYMVEFENILKRTQQDQTEIDEYQRQTRDIISKLQVA